MRLARLAATLALVGCGSVAFAAGVFAYQDHAFALTVSAPCLLPAATQTVTVVGGAAPAVVNLVVTYSTGAVAQNVTLEKTSAADVVYRWTVASNARPGEATVSVTMVPKTQNTAAGRIVFAIGAAGHPCTPPADTGPFYGAWILPASPVDVKKVCDSGVTGSATFGLSVFIPYNSARFALPAGWNVAAACNGAPAPLPALGQAIVVTLHEARLPAGAAAARDTVVTMEPATSEGTRVTVTVHNARAAAVVRLPQTGSPMQHDPTPWGLLLGVGIVAVSALTRIVADIGRLRRA